MTSFELFSFHYSKFSDTVHDSFGQSIMEEVFEPIGAELRALARLDEEMQRQFREIAMRTEEAASLG